MTFLATLFVHGFHLSMLANTNTTHTIPRASQGTQSGDVAVAVDTEEDSSDTNVAAQRNSTQASGTLSGTDTESE